MPPGTLAVVSLEHIHDWEHPGYRPSLIMSQQPAPSAVSAPPVRLQSRSRLSGGFIWVWLRFSDSRGEEGRTLRHADSGMGPENHFISLVVIPQSTEAETA